jgi:hypothetical protein
MCIEGLVAFYPQGLADSGMPSEGFYCVGI